MLQLSPTTSTIGDVMRVIPLNKSVLLYHRSINSTVTSSKYTCTHTHKYTFLYQKMADTSVVGYDGTLKIALGPYHTVDSSHLRKLY